MYHYVSSRPPADAVTGKVCLPEGGMWTASSLLATSALRLHPLVAQTPFYPIYPVKRGIINLLPVRYAEITELWAYRFIFALK